MSPASLGLPAARVIAIAAAVVAVLTSCSRTQPEGADPGRASVVHPSDVGADTRPRTRPPTADGDLIPADAARPAAGICLLPHGLVVTIVVNPDTPSPRCAFARPDQRLRVVNNSSGYGHSGEAITVTFAGRSRQLQISQSAILGGPFGRYLAPGVHLVRISLYGGSGAEIWLRQSTATP